MTETIEFGPDLLFQYQDKKGRFMNRANKSKPKHCSITRDGEGNCQLVVKSKKGNSVKKIPLCEINQVDSDLNPNRDAQRRSDRSKFPAKSGSSSEGGDHVFGVRFEGSYPDLYFGADSEQQMQRWVEKLVGLCGLNEQSDGSDFLVTPMSPPTAHFIGGPPEWPTSPSPFLPDRSPSNRGGMNVREYRPPINPPPKSDVDYIVLTNCRSVDRDTMTTASTGDVRHPRHLGGGIGGDHLRNGLSSSDRQRINSVSNVSTRDQMQQGVKAKPVSQSGSTHQIVEIPGNQLGRNRPRDVPPGSHKTSNTSTLNSSSVVPSDRVSLCSSRSSISLDPAPLAGSDGLTLFSCPPPPARPPREDPAGGASRLVYDSQYQNVERRSPEQFPASYDRPPPVVPRRNKNEGGSGPSNYENDRDPASATLPRNYRPKREQHPSETDTTPSISTMPRRPVESKGAPGADVRRNDCDLDFVPPVPSGNRTAAGQEYQLYTKMKTVTNGAEGFNTNGQKFVFPGAYDLPSTATGGATSPAKPLGGGPMSVSPPGPPVDRTKKPRNKVESPTEHTAPQLPIRPMSQLKPKQSFKRTPIMSIASNPAEHYSNGNMTPAYGNCGPDLPPHQPPVVPVGVEYMTIQKNPESGSSTPRSARSGYHGNFDAISINTIASTGAATEYRVIDPDMTKAVRDAINSRNQERIRPPVSAGPMGSPSNGTGPRAHQSLRETGTSSRIPTINTPGTSSQRSKPKKVNIPLNSDWLKSKAK